MLLKGAGKEVADYHIDSYRNAYSLDQLEKLVIDANFKIIKKEGKRNEWKFLIIAEKT